MKRKVKSHSKFHSALHINMSSSVNISSVTLRTPDVKSIVKTFDHAADVQIQNVVVDAIEKSNYIPPDMKCEIEKIAKEVAKDIVKLAIDELVVQLKKSPLASVDANGDGVISVSEAKQAAQKVCCSIV